MLSHRCTCDKEPNFHPEQPDRIGKILTLMDNNGLLDKCARPLPHEASNTDLELVHSSKHVEAYGLIGVSALELETMECGGKGVACDTVYNEKTSIKAAKLAVGCLLRITSQVLSGELSNGFAVIRPPGHHAEPSEAM